MTDAEYEELKYAAIAASYKPVRMTDDGTALLMWGIDDPWNPLDDDGDAFRLFSELRMSIRRHRDGSVSISWHDKDGFFVGNVVEEYGSLRNGDHSTAHVRRAITRAAAEIGKQMGGGNV